MTYANAQERRSLIAGLRDLADFLEGNPEVPAPRQENLMVFPPAGTDKEITAEIDRIAALAGAEISDRTADGGHYTAVRKFGRTQYEAVGILTRYRACHAAQMSYAENITIPKTGAHGPARQHDEQDQPQ
jgi:hypothetical protein